MFGLIKSLFSSNTDEVMTVAKGVGGWIDGQQFTEQEKSEAGLKVLDWKLKWLAATQGMNLARRYLAIMFAINFIVTFQICLVSVVVGFWMDKEVKPLVDSIVGVVGVFQLGWIMVTIIVFYFGSRVIADIKGKK